MTKQQVLEYGEKLRFEPWSGNSDHPCYMDAFRDAVELLWPMVEAAKNVVGSKSADLHLDLDMALSSLKQKIEEK